MAAPLPDGVELVLAPNPSMMTGEGTNSYVVWDPAAVDAGCLVVDPGPNDEGHLEHLALATQSHGGLRAILVTHGHVDHLEGAPRLRQSTSAPIWAWSSQGSPQADVFLADDDRVAVGARAVRALHTPGHRFDHLCFLVEDAGALFSGDLVAGSGTVVIPRDEGDLADYMRSLRRLVALDLQVILPGHGPAIEQPRALLEYYIRHREEREQLVLAGLAHGPRTIAQLVEVVYADVYDPQRRVLAAESLASHLHKLENEGRVVREGARAGAELWRLAPSAKGRDDESS